MFIKMLWSPQCNTLGSELAARTKQGILRAINMRILAGSPFRDLPTVDSRVCETETSAKILKWLCYKMG